MSVVRGLQTIETQMTTLTKKERNAVNAVRDFVDATACLRSYLEENDKTPLWDGSIFVYEGEPDKNSNLVGTLKTQIKGAEVETFQDKEHYRLTFEELNLYMKEGGLFFFVVELLKVDYSQRRIFYRALSPHTIQALVKQARQTNRGKESDSMQITMLPLPTDYRIVEDEMLNFIRDARKQVSFVGKPGLSLQEALKGNYPLKLETSFRFQKDTPIELQLTGQSFVLYQETPYASIPVGDVEVTARATTLIEEPVKVGDVTFFSRYTRCYEQKYEVINIDDCFFIAGPRKGYENSIQSRAEIKYPRTGTITDAIHKMEFLMALMNARSLTLGENDAPIDFGEEMNPVTEEVAYTYAIYRDIDAMWKQMQIPGIFSFDDFNEQGFQQYLNVVQHVYRCEPGIPNNAPKEPHPFFTTIPAGRLLLMLFFKPYSGKLYKSYDAFSFRYHAEDEKRYPMLSAALRYSQDVIFDNVHYDEQFECYKRCLNDDPSFREVLEYDLTELKKRMSNVQSKEKCELVKAFVERLEGLHY